MYIYLIDRRNDAAGIARRLPHAARAILLPLSPRSKGAVRTKCYKVAYGQYFLDAYSFLAENGNGVNAEGRGNFQPVYCEISEILQFIANAPPPHQYSFSRAMWIELEILYDRVCLPLSPMWHAKTSLKAKEGMKCILSRQREQSLRRDLEGSPRGSGQCGLPCEPNRWSKQTKCCSNLKQLTLCKIICAKTFCFL